MKKIFLHGALGQRFGHEWELHVSSPHEAVCALFANKPAMEKYLIDKEADGIFYGIKTAKDGQFITADEGQLTTSKNFHIFPVPDGAQSFVINLALFALTTAASLYISKAFAEAQERDDKAVEIQTKSYIYQGTTNRFQQGGSIPLGYGRMKVGSNVISACNLNYEYDSERGDIRNFSEGVYSIIPHYHKSYCPIFGPLGSSVLTNKNFDGNTEFREGDPVYKMLKNKIAQTEWGANDGLYSGPVMGTAAAAAAMAGGADETQGGVIGGYFEYWVDCGKGIDKTLLDNLPFRIDFDGNKIYDLGGCDWWPNTHGKFPLNPGQGIYSYAVIGTSAAGKSSYTCLQSVPQLDTTAADQIFYPINFGTGLAEHFHYGNPDPGPMAWPAAPYGCLNAVSAESHYIPIEVGRRYIGGDKSNGAGWYKLESVGVYKALDLVCEGAIEGFSDDNGTTLEFKKEISPGEREAACITKQEGHCTRNPIDDYLQAVTLDHLPVKQVINPGLTNDRGEDLSRDAYNVNDFDIDVGVNAEGIIGTDDQGALDEQYQFTAYTKDVGGELFGHRLLNPESRIIGIDSSLQDFEIGELYREGVYVRVLGEKFGYQVRRSLDNPYRDHGDYTSETLNDRQVVYQTSALGNVFFLANQSFNNYPVFNPSRTDYNAGDKVREIGPDGSTYYYHLGPGSTDFMGLYDDTRIYTEEDVGKILFDNEKAYRIRQKWDPSRDAGVDGFADIMEWRSRPDKTTITTVSPQLYVLSKLQSSPSYLSEVSITPGGTLDKDENLWTQIEIRTPEEVITVPGGVNIEPQINLFIPQGQIGGLVYVRKEEEEYYLSHTIINPLVEELYISLQVEELLYFYEGDFVEISYQFGEVLMTLVGALTGAGIVAAMKTSPEGAAMFAAIGGGIVGLGISQMATLNMGSKIENSGELWPAKGKYRIKYGNEGETPYFTDVYIYGVATGPYRKDVRIYLPPNPDQKDRVIKVYKLNRERNPVKEGEQAARYREKLSLAAVTEIVPIRLNYPNSVVIGTRVNAKDYPSIPQRNYNLKFKKVAVPTNYKPEIKEYFGNWDGLFKGQESPSDVIPESAKEWTDNPAWCLFDLLSNKRYGVGKFGVRVENIDKWTLYKIAKYCDDPIPTGYSTKYKKRKFNLQGPPGFRGSRKIRIAGPPGYTQSAFRREFNRPQSKLAIFYSDNTYELRTILKIENENFEIELDRAISGVTGDCATEIDYPVLEARYTFNAYIMNSQNAFKLINDMAAIFRAYAYWAGNAVHFFQDERKDSVMMFSHNNISHEGFSYSSTPRTSRTNSCKIRYLDRYNSYRSKLEYAEDRSSIDKYNMIEQSIDGFGITSKGQAKRAAEFLIQGAALETEVISFKTNVVGSYLRPGDIFDVIDDKRTVGRFAGRVLDITVSGDGKMAELNVDFPVRAIVDENDPTTWKKISLYNIRGNETMESLDEISDFHLRAKESGFGAPMVSDENIDDLRLGQISEYIVSNVSNNDTTIKIINSPYTFVAGKFTWNEAVVDAVDRGGQLATVDNDTDQSFVKSALPYDRFAWLGGFNRTVPAPEKMVWYQPQGCADDAITYFKWATGDPNLGTPIETDPQPLVDVLVTDVEEYNILADPEGVSDNFLAVSGSEDLTVHGDWITTGSQAEMGYILEKRASRELFAIHNIEGTPFVMEDSVNFATKQQYKAINITEESYGIFKIDGMQYNSGKFGYIEDNLNLPIPASPVIFTEAAVDPTTNIEVEILDEDLGSKTPGGLRAKWDKVDGAAGYRVQFFNEDTLLQTFHSVDKGGEEREQLEFRDERIVEGGIYYVRIYSKVR